MATTLWLRWPLTVSFTLTGLYFTVRCLLVVASRRDLAARFTEFAHIAMGASS